MRTSLSLSTTATITPAGRRDNDINMTINVDLGGGNLLFENR